MDGYEISFSEFPRSGLCSRRRTGLLHRPEEKLWADGVFREGPLEGFDGWSHSTLRRFDSAQWFLIDEWKLPVFSYILIKERTVYDNQRKSYSQIESCISKISPFINPIKTKRFNSPPSEET